MEPIEIYTSKRKSVLILLLSVALVVASIWVLTSGEFDYEDTTLVKVASVAGILLFGLGIIVSIKRLVKSELALIIAPEGLNINPKKSLDEFIPWDEILGFDEVSIKGTKIVIIVVKNPSHWIDKETSALKRKMMLFNVKNYQSPFNITANVLDRNHEELMAELSLAHDKYA